MGITLTSDLINITHGNIFGSGYTTLAEAIDDGCKVILDRRGIGLGKTIEANQLSVSLAKSGKTVVRVIWEYHLIEDNAALCEGAVIFRGKTQPGMCSLHTLSGSNDEYDKIGYCTYCKEQNSIVYSECKFQAQIRDIVNHRIIFAVPQLIPKLYQLLKDRENVVWIIDDTSLVDIVYKHEEIQLQALIRLQELFPSIIANITDYGFLRKQLNELTKANYDRINGNPNEFLESLTKRQQCHLTDIVHLISLYLKEDVIVKSIDEDDPSIPTLFEWVDWSLRGQTIIYQCATPSKYDIAVLHQLSFRTIGVVNGDAPHNDNWIVISLDKKQGTPKDGPTGKYSPYTIRKSPQFKRTYQKVISTEHFIKRYTNNEYVEFSGNKVFKGLLNLLLPELGDISHFGHYGRGSIGSNRIININSVVIAGIAYSNPKFSKRSPYNNENNIIHPSSRYIDKARVERAEINVVQEIGRIMRGNEDSGDHEKSDSTVNIGGSEDNASITCFFLNRDAVTTL